MIPQLPVARPYLSPDSIVVDLRILYRLVLLITSSISDWTNSVKNLATCGLDATAIFKLDISKNPKLVEALKIKTAPTFTIYKSSEMVWRETGVQDKDSLVGLMSEYLD